MVLGVFYHSALVYAGSEPWGWIIQDSESAPLFGAWAAISNSFRIPAFFILSGFFALLTLRRYGAGRFARQRLQRLFLPLIFTALLFNSAEAIYLAWFRGLSLEAHLNSPGYIKDGAWVRHLWFLNHLIIYFSLMALADRLGLISGLDALVEALKPLRRRLSGALYLLLLPLSALAISSLYLLAPGSFERILEAFSPFLLLWFLPFFLFGIWLYADPELMEEFSRFHPWILLLLPLLILVRLYLPGPKEAGGMLLAALILYLNSLSTWLGCQLVFALSRRLFQARSRFFRALSEASYSIYLFHHLGVVVGASLLLPLEISCYWKYLILVSGVSLYALLLHQLLILKVPLLHLIFNGRAR